jgi:hypothetical protein
MYCGAAEAETISRHTNRIRFPVAGIALAGLIAASGVVPVKGQPVVTPDTQIKFDIPPQPLSRALIAYSATTGLEIFYDAALADHQHSTAVDGVLTPSAALEVLLRGTGYAAKSTGLGAFTIAPEPREDPAAVEARRRLQPYFAAVQTRISDALCRNVAIAADTELLFQFWLSPSGVIERVEVIGEDGQRAEDQSYAAAIAGLRLAAPPRGMRQPVNIVIFPPSPNLICGSARTAGAGR